MSHVTHMNEPCHIYEWAMSHIWMSHVVRMNESCHIYKWVMSHIWMSHVTHMNESCHTYERVMSHICTSHVTHMNESCRAYECVMSRRVWISHVSRTSKTCVNKPYQMYSCHTCHVCHVLCVTGLVHRQDWSIDLACDMTHSHVSHDSFTRVTLLIHMSLIVNESCHIYDWVMSHIWISRVTSMNQSCRTCVWVLSPIRLRHVTQVQVDPEQVELTQTKHSYVQHASFVCATSTRPICMSHRCAHIWMRRVAHMNVSSVSVLCATRLIHNIHVTYEWGVLHIWFSSMCNTPHS